MEHISPVHNTGMQRSDACCGNRPTIRPSARGGDTAGVWMETVANRQRGGWIYLEQRSESDAQGVVSKK